jgi:acyl carrier protein
MNIEERIIKVIKNRFPDTPINREMNLREDLGMESLDLMEFVMDLEDEFNVNIPDDRYSTVKTIDDIIIMMEKHCDQANEECE